MVKWLAPILLTVSLGCWALTKTYADSPPADNSLSYTIQRIVPQNLDGSYAGKVYLRDKTNRRDLMTGLADLDVKGNEFVLCEKIKDKKKCSGKRIVGQISFSTIPERGDLGVGTFQLQNDTPIEIRWHRNPNCDIFKIVRAKGARREFRFCSNIEDTECFGKIRPCRSGITRC